MTAPSRDASFLGLHAARGGGAWRGDVYGTLAEKTWRAPLRWLLDEYARGYARLLVRGGAARRPHPPRSARARAIRGAEPPAAARRPQSRLGLYRDCRPCLRRTGRWGTWPSRMS